MVLGLIFSLIFITLSVFFAFRFLRSFKAEQRELYHQQLEEIRRRRWQQVQESAARRNPHFRAEVGVVKKKSAGGAGGKEPGDGPKPKEADLSDIAKRLSRDLGF